MAMVSSQCPLISEASFDTSIPRLTTWATSAKYLNIIRFHNQDGRQHPFRMSRVAHFQHFDKIPVCRRRRPTSPVLRKLFASPALTGLALHLHSIRFGWRVVYFGLIIIAMRPNWLWESFVFRPQRINDQIVAALTNTQPTLAHLFGKIGSFGHFGLWKDYHCNPKHDMTWHDKTWNMNIEQ